MIIVVFRTFSFCASSHFEEYLLQFSQFGGMKRARDVFDIDFSLYRYQIIQMGNILSIIYHLLSKFSSQVSYPANTNILYVDLQAVEEVGSRKNASCLPGMVLNLKKSVSYVDHLGFECRYSLFSNSP